MDGFVYAASGVKKGCGANVNDPACSNSAAPDVMGYHTAAEIPNYWTYAKDFVLDDHMFEPVKSWSLPDHLYLVSGWSAKCSSPAPSSCSNQIKGPYTPLQMQEYVDQAMATGTADGHQRLDRHHLAALQQARPLGLLRPDRGPARLRERRSGRVRPGRPELSDPRDLEPAPPLRGRPEGPPAPQHPAARQLLHRRQEGNAALGHVDRTLPGRQRAPSGERPPGAGLRHRADQRRHEEPRLGLDGHLLAVGRLGGLLRQRGARRRWTRTATACGSRHSSSRPMPSGATSTPRRSAATPTSSSSRTTSWAAPGSTPRPTDARTQGRRPRGREGPRQHAAGLRFQPEAPGTGPAGDQPRDGLPHHPGVLQRKRALRRLHGDAAEHLRGPGRSDGCAPPEIGPSDARVAL